MASDGGTGLYFDSVFFDSAAYEEATGTAVGGDLYWSFLFVVAVK